MSDEIRYNAQLVHALSKREEAGTTLGTIFAEFIAEEEEVQRRKDALKSLKHAFQTATGVVGTADEKMVRTSGDWMQLSGEECAMLHKREKSHLSLSSQATT